MKLGFSFPSPFFVLVFGAYLSLCPLVFDVARSRSTYNPRIIVLVLRWRNLVIAYRFVLVKFEGRICWGGPRQSLSSCLLFLFFFLRRRISISLPPGVPREYLGDPDGLSVNFSLLRDFFFVVHLAVSLGASWFQSVAALTVICAPVDLRSPFI